MGRLASGIPQIPPKCNHLARPVPPTDPVLTALRGPQSVVLLKCGPEPRSRLLYVSQLLLNDAAERGQKIKIACTLCNGMSPKEMSTIVALDRNEKVRKLHFFCNFVMSRFIYLAGHQYCRISRQIGISSCTHERFDFLLQRNPFENFDFQR